METQAALIWSDGAVELDPVSLVHLDSSIVIYPRYPERYNSFRLRETLKNTFPAVFFLIGINDQF